VAFDTFLGGGESVGLLDVCTVSARSYTKGVSEVLVSLVDSASALLALGRGVDFFPERMMFALGTAGFLLSCLSSLFYFGTIRP
jgi:hypothetical protein